MKYQAWLHWSVSERCVMNCDYCRSSDGEHNLRKNAPLSRIDIPKLIETLDDTHKIFRLSFTGGGEPFLVPNLVEACLELTKKHYISFNTNLSEKHVSDFIKKINPERVLSIDASCHIKALEKRHLLQRYINNFLLCKEKDIPITAIEVAYPPLVHEVEKYTRLFKKEGIDLIFGTFIGRYNGKKYPQAYTEAELEAFGFTKDNLTSNYPGAINNLPFFCNAGYNVGIVQPNGDIYPCDSIKESIGNIYKKISFNRHISICPFKFCGCPLHSHDYRLFEKAVQEDRWFVRRHVWKHRILHCMSVK